MRSAAEAVAYAKALHALKRCGMFICAPGSVGIANPQVHNNLGLLYRDRELVEESIREFQRALIINPHTARRGTIWASS